MKKYSFICIYSLLLGGNVQAITIEEALVNAYQNNPELIAAREELKKYDEKIFKAISGFIPKIDFKLRDKYGQSDTAYTKNGLEKTSDWYNTQTRTSSFSLEQNLYEGGKTMISMKIAKYYIESERSSLKIKEQEVLLKSLNAYLNVVYSQEKLSIAKENLNSYEQKYQFVKNKHQEGFAKDSDLAYALSRTSDAESTLVDYQAKYQSSIAIFNEVIGMEPDSLTSKSIFVNLPTDENSLLNNVLKNNPEFNRSQYAKKYLDLTVKYNLASMLPTVNFVAETSKFRETKSNQNAIQPYTNNRSVSINVKVPIYQQGLEYSNVRASRAESAKAKYILKKDKAATLRKVSQSWYEYLSAKQMLKSSLDAVKASELALSGKQREYEEGQISLNELLEIQDNLFKYRIKFVDAIINLENKRYYMSSIAGELTASALRLPTKIYNPAENYEKVRTKLIGF